MSKSDVIEMKGTVTDALPNSTLSAIVNEFTVSLVQAMSFKPFSTLDIFHIFL